VNAASLADDVYQALRRSAFGERAAREAPSPDLVPAQNAIGRGRQTRRSLRARCPPRAT
jgi:hypothetical protein